MGGWGDTGSQLSALVPRPMMLMVGCCAPQYNAADKRKLFFERVEIQC